MANAEEERRNRASVRPYLLYNCGGGAIDEDTFEAAAESKYLSPRMYHAIIKNLNESDDDVHRKSHPMDECVKFYCCQSNQDIGSVQLSVPVYFDHGLCICWIRPLNNAIQAINEAAPGLYLHKVSDKSAAKIVVVGNFNDGCWTEGNIILPGNVNISLDKLWIDKSGTALHEMMHALGFDHEHERKDGERSLKYNLSKLDAVWKLQYQVSEKVSGLTRFDPHSIMMYPLCKELQQKPEGDTVWDTIAGDARCQVLSELDKVGLNILYRPVQHAGYTPYESKKTWLMYCGRKNCVLAGDGRCGPLTGANCAACRVQKTWKSSQINKVGRWQGWTGLVYCGKSWKPDEGEPSTECCKKWQGWKGLLGCCKQPNEDKDKVHVRCGPNNGEPCPECRKLIETDEIPYVNDSYIFIVDSDID